MKEQYTRRDHEIVCERKENKYALIWESIKRAFNEFLLFPSFIIACFLLLAFIVHNIDNAEVKALRGFTNFMKDIMFSDSRGTSGLLGAVVAGIMTIATFTITMLLIVVQQSASSLSSQVFDRFLRSRSNQTYFGFFLGLTFFALIELATVNDSFNPVIGATLVFIFTMFALFLLIVLVYTTINQMRSSVVIEAIHQHIVEAGKSHLKLVESTRRKSEFEGEVCIGVRVRRHGYIVAVDIHRIAEGIEKVSGIIEVEFLASIGSYIPYDYKIALIKGSNHPAAEKIAKLVCSSVRIERQRDITRDPAHGIGQLENIGWTAISTAKSKPHTGAHIIRALGNVLLYWGLEDKTLDCKILPIVYKDNVKEKLLDAFENLAVVSSESMQHQSFYRILNTLGLAYCRMNKKEQDRIENVLLTLLSVLGDHALTAKLDQSLSDITELMNTAKRFHIANAIKEAHSKLRESHGKINSRATRV